MKVFTGCYECANVFYVLKTVEFYQTTEEFLCSLYLDILRLHLMMHANLKTKITIIEGSQANRKVHITIFIRPPLDLKNHFRPNVSGCRPGLYFYPLLMMYIIKIANFNSVLLFIYIQHFVFELSFGQLTFNTLLFDTSNF